MSGTGTPNFFLNTIGGNIQNRLTKAQLQSFYHSKIADRQQRKGKLLSVVFDKIDNIISKINVDTDDINESIVIKAKTAALMDLANEIRAGEFNKDVEFLNALKIVFDYNLEE